MNGSGGGADKTGGKPGPWDVVDGRCNGRKTGGGGLCRHTAGWGTDHPGIGACRKHGGNTITHRISAERVRRRRAAEAAVATYGLPREVEPAQALLEEIWRSAGHVDYLAAIVAQTDEAQLVYGLVEQTVTSGGPGRGNTTKHAARPSIWLELYRRERRHLVEVCRVAIAAGIAERQVRIAEAQGRMVAKAIQGILEELGVADREDAPKTVRRHLMLLDGGTA